MNAVFSSEKAIRFRSRWTANPPRPQPRRATEMATNVKWYQMVAEKMRVRPISNMRPERLIRNMPR